MGSEMCIRDSIHTHTSERPNLGSAEPLYLTYSVRVRGSGSVKVVAELFGKKFGSFFLGPRRELHMKY